MDQLNVVTLAQAKLWLRVDPDYDYEDSLITSLIKTAVNQAELYTLQILWQRPISVRTGANGRYRIFEYPLISIESLIDNDLDEIEYDTDVTEWYTEVISDDLGLQSLVFVAGYGWTYDGGTEVPEDIITAIKEYITYLYEHRDDPKVSMPGVVQMMLNPWRRSTLF